MEPEKEQWLMQLTEKVMRFGKAMSSMTSYVEKDSLLTVDGICMTVEEWHGYIREGNSVLQAKNDIEMGIEHVDQSFCNHHSGTGDDTCDYCGAEDVIQTTGDFSTEGKLRKASNRILNALAHRYKFDREDPNLTKTPERVAKALLEITDGYDVDIAKLLSTSFPSDDYDQMIVVKDIDYFSTCAHHMFPFHGKVAIGYLPNAESKMVVGLSKLPRLVRAFSRRLQNQERMTMQIANAINDHLKPRGVGVLVYDSIHLCSHMRGVEESHSTMETSALLGEFRDDATVRAEFMSMVYGGRR